MKTIKVIILEDNSLISEIIKGYLLIMPEVSLIGIFDNQREVIKKCNEKKPDLVIVDCDYWRDKPLFVRRMREIAPNIRILGIIDQPKLFNSLYRAGFDHVISRDFLTEKYLIESIRNIVLSLPSDMLHTNSAERAEAEKAAKEKPEGEGTYYDDDYTYHNMTKEVGEREVQEKAEELLREAAEKAAREKSAREVAEKAVREKVERESAQKMRKESRKVQVVDKFKISIAYPKLLSKRFESSFLIHIYLPEKRAQVMRNIKSEFQKQKINEQLQSSSIKFGQTIKVKFYSPAFIFPESVTKLIDNPINKITFLGMPKDNCEPGLHKILVSISDANTDQEINSITINAQSSRFCF